MFRRMDDSGNKVLEFEEFHKGIIETGLKGVSEDDAREMFNHFDKDGGGTVNIDEFLMAIRVGTLILPHKSSKVQKHLPYARHYKPRLVYFFTPFPKTIYVL